MNEWTMDRAVKPSAQVEVTWRIAPRAAAGREGFKGKESNVRDVKEWPVCA